MKRDMDCLRVADDALAALLPEAVSGSRLAQRNPALAADLRHRLVRLRELIERASKVLIAEPIAENPVVSVYFCTRFRCADGRGIALSSRGELYYRPNDKGGKWSKVKDHCREQDALAYVLSLGVDFQRIVECKPREEDDAFTDEPDVSLPVSTRRLSDAQQ